MLFRASGDVSLLRFWSVFAGTKRTWWAKSHHRGLGKTNFTVPKHARNIFCFQICLRSQHANAFGRTHLRIGLEQEVRQLWERPSRKWCQSKNPRRIQEESKKNPRRIQEESKKNARRIQQESKMIRYLTVMIVMMQLLLCQSIDVLRVVDTWFHTMLLRSAGSKRTGGATPCHRGLERECVVNRSFRQVSRKVCLFDLSSRFEIRPKLGLTVREQHSDLNWFGRLHLQIA